MLKSKRVHEITTAMRLQTNDNWSFRSWCETIHRWREWTIDILIANARARIKDRLRFYIFSHFVVTSTGETWMHDRRSKRKRDERMSSGQRENVKRKMRNVNDRSMCIDEWSSQVRIVCSEWKCAHANRNVPNFVHRKNFRSRESTMHARAHTGHNTDRPLFDNTIDSIFDCYGRLPLTKQQTTVRRIFCVFVSFTSFLADICIGRHICIESEDAHSLYEYFFWIHFTRECINLNRLRHSFSSFLIVVFVCKRAADQRRRGNKRNDCESSTFQIQVFELHLSNVLLSISKWPESIWPTERSGEFISLFHIESKWRHCSTMFAPTYGSHRYGVALTGEKFDHKTVLAIGSSVGYGLDFLHLRDF